MPVCGRTAWYRWTWARPISIRDRCRWTRPPRRRRYSLDIEGETVDYGAVSMGNPHAVLKVHDVKSAPVEHLGPRIERHRRFPRRTNVGFMQIVDRGHIGLRVFERGVGETLACGTGACAAAAVGREQGLLEADVRVDLPGGTAHVSWHGPGEPCLAHRAGRDRLYGHHRYLDSTGHHRG